MARLKNMINKETAGALDEIEVATKPGEALDNLMSSSVEVVRKFVLLLTKHDTEDGQQLGSMAYNSLRKKVADALIAIEKKYCGGKEEFIINISRGSLANIAGAAKESLVRVLSDFKDEGLIEIISQGDIVIRDSKKLQ